MMGRRQFTPYQENLAIGLTSSLDKGKHCKRCSSPITCSNHGHLCDVCWSMLEVLATPYWHRLHYAWNEENVALRANKARLLDPNYGEYDEPDSPSRQA